MKTKACKFVGLCVAALVGTTSLGEGISVAGSVAGSADPYEDLSDSRLIRVPRGAIGSSTDVRAHRENSNVDEENPYYTRRRGSIGQPMKNFLQDDRPPRFLGNPPGGPCAGGLRALFAPTLSAPTLSTPYLPAFLLMAFTAYRLSPPIYEAKSEFTMDIRRSQNATDVGVVGNGFDSYGSSYEEVFNTRQSDWRSDGVVSRVFDIYRSCYPNSQVTSRELAKTIQGAELKLVPHSRLIAITVRSRTPEIAAALANAYAQAIEAFTDEENKKRCDKAVAQIHRQVVNQQNEDDRLARKLLDFRTKNKIDSLKVQQAIFNQSLSATTANVLEYEKRVTEAKEWVDVLETAQNAPENFDELPTGVPRYSAIAAAYTKRMNAKVELDVVKTWANKEHPKLVALEKNYRAVDKEYKDTVERAYKTAKADLAVNERLLDKFMKKNNELKERIESIELMIGKTDAILTQLTQEKEASSAVYQDLLKKENQVRVAAEQKNEIIRIGRPATVPTRPGRRLVR